MRHGQALWIGLLAGLLAGCSSGPPVHTTNWLDRLLSPAGPVGSYAVQLDFALIERPLGDGYLNQDLWVAADEQVIALEKRALLEGNGIRIGQVGGITPAGLQALLTNERSCVNPRRIRTAPGRATKVVLGPEMASCRFHVQRHGEAVPIALENAQCTFEVTATLTADGRTRLAFEPQVSHGATNLFPRPADDLSGWVLREERPTAKFPELRWEVTLAPNEYLIIGGRYDHPDTLGEQSFLRREEPTPVQRLLVIRTSRAGTEPEGWPAEREDALPPGPPPLACQAAMTTARGTGR
jgi:hypothetical protein